MIINSRTHSWWILESWLFWHRMLWCAYAVKRFLGGLRCASHLPVAVCSLRWGWRSQSPRCLCAAAWRRTALAGKLQERLHEEVWESRWPEGELPGTVHHPPLFHLHQGKNTFIIRKQSFMPNPLLLINSSTRGRARAQWLQMFNTELYRKSFLLTANLPGVIAWSVCLCSEKKPQNKQFFSLWVL